DVFRATLFAPKGLPNGSRGFEPTEGESQKKDLWTLKGSTIEKPGLTRGRPFQGRKHNVNGRFFHGLRPWLPVVSPFGA
ncbi:MAG: hypothetical protein V2B18_04340, partial [Pseudomonadota bacterium]